MSKVKVKRKDDKGQEAEIEVEEAEVTETDTRVEPEQTQGKQTSEKSLSQSEVNKLMADQRREHKKELDTLRAEFDTYRQGVEAEKKQANDAAAAKVEKLRENLPEAIGKLLDKLTPIEQLEWLSDPANVIEKKQIGALPDGRTEPGRERRAQQII